MAAEGKIETLPVKARTTFDKMKEKTKDLRESQELKEIYPRKIVKKFILKAYIFSQLVKIRTLCFFSW